MTEEELVCVESHLGPLPAAFRRFLLTAAKEDLRDLGCGTYDVGKLIKENARVRLNADDYRVHHPNGGDAPWPPGWVVVSDNGGGDYWFVQGEDDGQALWFWSHASWDVRKDASTFAESIEECRERRREYKRFNPPSSRRVETIDHPALGPVEFRGSAFYLKGHPPVFIWADVLDSDSDPVAVRAVLDAVAPLVSEAVASERRVFEDALPQLVELQHQPMWWLPDATKLVAEQIRERLAARTVDIRADPDGDRAAAEVEYTYDGGEAFGWEPVVVRCGPDLAVREVEQRDYI